MKLNIPRTVLLAGAGYSIALAIGILVLFFSHADSVGFSGADESAHFLNSYFVNLYLKNQWGVNPMAFATDFYLHYPKISIGHWPPAYYGLVGTLFLVVPASLQNAFIINLLVCALPAAGVAVVLGYATSVRMALLGALVYSLVPMVLVSYSFFMLDQALAACAVATTIIWVAYTIQPSWKRALLFAGLFAFAVLVKGNGWLLLLLPVFHMLTMRSWHLLRRPELYAASAVAVLLVGPWYILTSKISADGFNYQPGLAYAVKALAFNVEILFRNLGYFWLPLVAFAVVSGYANRLVQPARWTVVSGCLSLILATLTLQSIVPVDLVDRYLSPALPAIVVAAFVGMKYLAEMLFAKGQNTIALIVSAASTLLLLAPGIDFLMRQHPKIDLRMAATVPSLASAPPSGWLIDGTSGAEGAFIAAMAIQDRPLVHYAVRSSKLLAESNFMGAGYRLKFSDAGAILAEIQRLGIRGVVIVRIGDEPAFPHSRQLAEALSLPKSPFRRIKTLAHGNRRGTTDVFESVAAPVLDVKAIRQLGLPAKAALITSPGQQP